MCNMDGVSNIVRLEELEKELSDGTVIWRVNGQEVRVWNLWNHHKRVAVARVNIPPGAIFPIHTHDQVESLTCFDGEGKVIIRHNDGSQTEHFISIGDVVKLAQGEPHSVEAITDLWLIGITVPSSPAFPE